MESSEDDSAPTIIFVEAGGGTKATHGDADAKKRANIITMKKAIVGCRYQVKWQERDRRMKRESRERGRRCTQHARDETTTSFGTMGPGALYFFV